jgi:TfoX/Sxy family transcriptional regulator of competence genes
MTSIDFKDYIQDQCSFLGYVTFKKMFGEYGMFYKEKMVGVLADNKLYIKPTDEGKSYLIQPQYEAFYAKGKPYFLIEDTDNRESLWKLIVITYDALPMPKEKKKKG